MGTSPGWILSQLQVQRLYQIDKKKKKTKKKKQNKPDRMVAQVLLLQEAAHLRQMVLRQAHQL